MNQIAIRSTILRKITEMLGQTGEQLTNDQGEVCLSESHLLTELHQAYSIPIADSMDILGELTKAGMIKSSEIQNSKDKCIAINTAWVAPDDIESKLRHMIASSGRVTMP